MACTDCLVLSLPLFICHPSLCDIIFHPILICSLHSCHILEITYTAFIIASPFHPSQYPHPIIRSLSTAFSILPYPSFPPQPLPNGSPLLVRSSPALRVHTSRTAPPDRSSLLGSPRSSSGRVDCAIRGRTDDGDGYWIHGYWFRTRKLKEKSKKKSDTFGEGTIACDFHDLIGSTWASQS